MQVHAPSCSVFGCGSVVQSALPAAVLLALPCHTYGRALRTLPAEAQLRPPKTTQVLRAIVLDELIRASDCYARLHAVWGRVAFLRRAKVPPETDLRLRCDRFSDSIALHFPYKILSPQMHLLS